MQTARTRVASRDGQVLPQFLLNVEVVHVDARILDVPLHWTDRVADPTLERSDRERQIGERSVIGDADARRCRRICDSYDQVLLVIRIEVQPVPRTYSRPASPEHIPRNADARREVLVRRILVQLP